MNEKTVDLFCKETPIIVYVLVGYIRKEKNITRKKKKRNNKKKMYNIVI